MIPRAICEQVVREAVAACDPTLFVRRALDGSAFELGFAVGKSALAMARGAGRVMRGIVVAPVLDGKGLPMGWTARDAGHPEPDERSVAAADAVIELVRGARQGDRVLALISGGASALIEQPIGGLTLDELRARVAATMASGASIRELNSLRTELSAIKGGKLARMCAGSITTLIASDVIGDDPRIVGSGPTVTGEPGEHVEVVIHIVVFAQAVRAAMRRHDLDTRRLDVPMAGDPAALAEQLAAETNVIAWGEPTVHVPADHGVGGRAQQLALHLAKHLRGTDRSAFVAGSDGIDGPRPPDRPAPAGAYVDGTTWDAITAAGIDPQRALDRCDAGTALHAVGALFVPGATGINHADIAIIG